MEKNTIILIFSLMISFLLLFYSLVAILNPQKLKELHEKLLSNSNNILSKYALNESKKNKNTINIRFTGFVALLMAIIMIYLFTSKLLNV
jgi:hypothetical protein